MFDPTRVLMGDRVRIDDDRSCLSGCYGIAWRVWEHDVDVLLGRAQLPTRFGRGSVLVVDPVAFPLPSGREDLLGLVR